MHRGIINVRKLQELAIELPAVNGLTQTGFYTSDTFVIESSGVEGFVTIEAEIIT